jgi:uncharacterized protein YchJ
MINKRSKRLFDKYNPESQVKRCPSERLDLRKELDLYAKAAVNLYGVIPIKELTDIYNNQNSDKTNAEEVFSLLLLLILRKEPVYCFYKDYIVHSSAIDDFRLVEDILAQQAGKPRFIPNKEEFLNFSAPNYVDKKQRKYWQKIYDYLVKNWPKNIYINRTFNKIKRHFVKSNDFALLAEIFDENRIIFPNNDEIQAFTKLLVEAKCNSRLMENKGYTNIEIWEIMRKLNPNTEDSKFAFLESVDIKPNDLCPCGSSKKYKNCCLPIIEAKTSQLSHADYMLFCDIWYRLLSFVNHKLKIIDDKNKQVSPSFVSEDDLYKLRLELWNNPELIHEYISKTALTQEKVAILNSWHDFHLSGLFFLIEYLPDYAVFMASGEGSNDRLYGVKGLISSIAESVQQPLPVAFETVLLPFKDMVIFDSFLVATSVNLEEGMLQMLSNSKNKAMAQGIFTRLDVNREGWQNILNKLS